MAAASPKDFVKSMVDSNKIAVFSKSYCPFCVKAKKALADEGLEFSAVELDQRDDGAAIQAALLDITGQRTVPNIFVGQKHLGGCDDTLAAIRKGSIKNML